MAAILSEGREGRIPDGIDSRLSRCGRHDGRIRLRLKDHCESEAISVVDPGMGGSVIDSASRILCPDLEEIHDPDPCLR